MCTGTLHMCVVVHARHHVVHSCGVIVDVGIHQVVGAIVLVVLRHGIDACGLEVGAALHVMGGCDIIVELVVVLHHVVHARGGVVDVVVHRVIHAWGTVVVVAHHVLIIMASVGRSALTRHGQSQVKCIYVEWK